MIVFDIYSVSHWEFMLREWVTGGGHPIALVGETLIETELLRLLDLGARGIVHATPQLESELPMAIQAVMSGHLWVNRALLEKHVNHTHAMLKRVPGATRKFTLREQQVLRLLLRQYTNKQIAALLSISERTVKFHVGNILLKTGLRGRHALIGKQSASSLDLLTAS